MKKTLKQRIAEINFQPVPFVQPARMLGGDDWEAVEYGEGVKA